MKVILENKISSVSASSEDASYPASYVLNDSPKRVWKGDSVDTATLTCSTSGAIDTLAIFNTNAQSVSITISDPNEFQWEATELEWTEITWIAATTAVEFEIETQANNSAIWATFDEIIAAVDVAITLSTATGTVIQAGVVVIGEGTEFKNPQYGLSQGLVDYSIAEQLQNGAHYYKQRDIVRSFDAQIVLARDNDFYTFMHSLAREHGLGPKAWRLTDKDSFEWVVYARFGDMPSGSHSYPSHSPISFSLIEVI
jgi:hypothetical protein